MQNYKSLKRNITGSQITCFWTSTFKQYILTINQYKGWSFDRICKIQLSDENKFLIDNSILERYRKYKCCVFIDFEYTKWYNVSRWYHLNDLPYIYSISKMHKNPYKHRFIAGHPSVPPSLYLFFSQNCLHILSKVFRSTAKQPTPEVGSIRCGSSRIQRSY